MTVSMFDTYLQRMQLHRTERIMDVAQASLYAQVTGEGKRKMWNSWAHIVSTIHTRMLMSDASVNNENPIIWNGRKISVRGLIDRFLNTFGKKSVVRQQ